MRWKYLLGTVGFIGIFLLGTIVGPYSEQAEVTNATEVSNQLPVSRTTYQISESQVEEGDFICPIDETPMRKGGAMGQYFAGTLQEDMAERLGMTVEELLEARREGNSIAELAEINDVDLEELTVAMIEARKVELEKLLKEEVITEEQMEVMLENIESRIETAIQRETVGPINGRTGKMGRGQGGRWNNDMDKSQNWQLGNCPYGGLY